MSVMKLSDIILGDNPLFGVSHSATSKRLSKDEIVDVMVESTKLGIEKMMISPHSGLSVILRQYEIVCEQEKIIPMSLSYVFPYPHALNDSVAERGVLGLIRDLPISSLIKACVRSLPSLLFSKRIVSFRLFFEALIKVSISNLGSSASLVSEICLHNIVTDMMLATDNDVVLLDFVHACDSLDYKSVLITQNLQSLIKVHLPENTIFCSTINPNGYMVNPGLMATCSSIENCKNEIWAMQVFASGTADIEMVKKMLNENGAISKVLIASKSVARIQSNLDYLCE